MAGFPYGRINVCVGLVSGWASCSRIWDLIGLEELFECRSKDVFLKLLGHILE
jgi:hypothetical protein